MLVAHGHTRHQAQETAQSAPGKPGSFKVDSISPVSGERRANGSFPITVSFNAPVAANTPQPQLKPAVPGNWSAFGNVMTFTPDSPFKPGEKITVLVPAGVTGVHSANGVTLTKTVTDHFTTGGYSSLRLAQLLGLLGYLPLHWTPGSQGALAEAERSTDTAAQSQADLAFSPPPGTFSWEPGYPGLIHTFWNPNKPNVIITGAMMAFESQHGMTLNETPTPKLWSALFQAAKRQQRNKVGYTYAIANKNLPETLTIWHDGRIVERTLANTGIPVSPTVDGTFPVYLKFRFQIMRGINPDGSAYADPVSWVSYFNGGDAVHYFPRGAYGFQQSLGCVELPWDSAERAYPYLTYGSLVTVTG